MEELLKVLLLHLLQRLKDGNVGDATVMPAVEEKVQIVSGGQSYSYEVTPLRD